MSKRILSRLERLKDLVTQMGHDDDQYEKWHEEIKSLEASAPVSTTETKKFVFTLSEENTVVRSRPATPGKRANKMVTQRAIDAMRQYLDGTWEKERLGGFWKMGNTSAVCHSDGSLTISLHENPILRLEKHKGLVSRVCVFDGGRYDYDGNPSHLTRERLNGLLDALSALKYLPDNIKVIMDHEYGLCYIARFEQKAVLNSKYHNRIDIQRNPIKFVIEKIHQAKAD